MADELEASRILTFIYTQSAGFDLLESLSTTNLDTSVVFAS